MDQQSPASPSEDQGSPKRPKTTFIPPEDRKNSRFGIASFILSIVTLLGYILLGALGTTMIEPYMTENGPLLEPTQETLEAMTTLAAVFIIVMIINITGLVLGVVGCLSKTRKRAVAVIATIVNGVVIITIGALFLFVLNA
ncbi:hypothetical protein MKY82_26435 [Paenibacillus sp. FSL W7-1279]|uniref:hypothetical protein n=1 Tax=Paenibacillus TaxID=44249 RepID=UPI001F33E7D4|nr:MULTISPECIES: hypothetical protein [Paenibacillus]MCT1401724.1 hypothetical protein [Paenibacillus sp. p3-SID867]